MSFPNQRVSLIQYGVFKYPKGLEHWRCYRIEYGGHAEDCITEGSIWLPPNLDPREVEQLIRAKAKLGGPDTRLTLDDFE